MSWCARGARVAERREAARVVYACYGSGQRKARAARWDAGRAEQQVKVVKEKKKKRAGKWWRKVDSEERKAFGRVGEDRRSGRRSESGRESERERGRGSERERQEGQGRDVN